VLDPRVRGRRSTPVTANALLPPDSAVWTVLLACRNLRSQFHAQADDAAKRYIGRGGMSAWTTMQLVGAAAISCNE